MALMSSFGLTDLQANAILEMRLSRLTGLEREKILQELKDLLVEIQRLKDILADEQKLYAVIVEELREIKDDAAGLGGSEGILRSGFSEEESEWQDESEREEE